MMNTISREAAVAAMGAPMPLARTPIWVADFSHGVIPRDCSFARASSARATNAAGQNVLVAANTPRLDYSAATGAPLGLLMEGSATNYFLDSTLPASQSCALSTGTYTLWVEGGGSCAVSAGTAAGSGFGLASAGSPVVFSIGTAGSVDFVVTGNPTHVQCEDNAFVTSKIVTGDSAATRDADTLQLNALSSMGFNPAAGTFLVGFNLGISTTLSQRLIELGDGASSNRLVLGFASTAICRFQVYTSGTRVADVIAGSVTVGSNVRFACAYANNSYAACINGGVTATGSGALPGGLSSAMAMGNGLYTSGFALRGHLQRIAYYPRRMDNNELRMLTR